MSIIATGIVTAFGAYYLEEGQNMDRLKDALRQKSVTPEVCVPIITESDVYRSANVSLGEIVQGFQKGFTPKGDVTFTPNEIRLRNIKADITIDPDDVKGKWLGFLASLTEADRTQWPIVRYILEKHIATRIPHDMETQAYFKGVYAAPTTGTAGAASAALDGFRKLIDDGLTAGTVQALTLSAAPSASNIFDIIEEVADDVLTANAALEGIPMNVCVSPSWMRAYFRDKRNTHGTDTNYTGTGMESIDFTPNFKLVALPSMEGTNYIFATPAENMVHLRKVNGMTTPNVQLFDRQVKVLLDWYEGIGFLHNELVFAYKPA